LVQAQEMALASGLALAQVSVAGPLLGLDLGQLLVVALGLVLVQLVVMVLQRLSREHPEE
jgi:hypothetical protein